MCFHSKHWFISLAASFMTQQDLKILLGCIPCILLVREMTESLKNLECFRCSSTVMLILGTLSKTEHYTVSLFLSVSAAFCNILIFQKVSQKLAVMIFTLYRWRSKESMNNMLTYFPDSLSYKIKSYLRLKTYCL